MFAYLYSFPPFQSLVVPTGGSAESTSGTRRLSLPVEFGVITESPGSTLRRTSTTSLPENGPLPGERSILLAIFQDFQVRITEFFFRLRLTGGQPLQISFVVCLKRFFGRIRGYQKVLSKLSDPYSQQMISNHCYGTCNSDI